MNLKNKATNSNKKFGEIRFLWYKKIRNSVKKGTNEHISKITPYEIKRRFLFCGAEFRFNVFFKLLWCNTASCYLRNE